MAKQEFRAESRRVLELMINSIYTHKEIFIRELISNASDALDKRAFRAMTDDALVYNRDDYEIFIEIDHEGRTFTIRDSGIGMTREELESNLGVIAKSGTLEFAQAHEARDEVSMIGQFGVGFYSAFMVAKEVRVRSRSLDAEQAYEWYSEGADGYTIHDIPPMEPGTEISLLLKDNTEHEDFDRFLQEYTVKSLVRRFSDYIKYPIKMSVTQSVPSADDPDKYEDKSEVETLNSMVPIWRKSKSELTDEDYNAYYFDKHFGFEAPMLHIHESVEGAVSYTTILYIPAKAPYDFYTKEYEKGLELYSNSVLIMQKCGDLLPDHFAFVKGLVDSADFSLNISREILQHDRQLKLIAKQLEKSIRNALASLMENDREKYEAFFGVFGRQLKYGVYADWGMHKDALEDLLLFYSSTERKLVSFKEYKDRMQEDQKVIYYAAGDSVEKLSRLPQAELLNEKGIELLFFVDDVDEFAIRVMREYGEVPFQNVSEGSLDLGEQAREETDEQRALFDAIKEVLGEQVNGVRASTRLKSHPVCMVTEGGFSIEMEKVMSHIPDNPGVKAERFLEINTEHPVFAALQAAHRSDADTERFPALARILYGQALLIEGLSVDDPVAYANDIWAVIGDR